MEQNIKGKQSPMISEEEAQMLLKLSRKAEWVFPSSSGRPIAKSIPEWLENIKINRELLSGAVQFFLEKNRPDEAYELSANVWLRWA